MAVVPYIFEDLITLRHNPAVPEIYDIELNHIEQIKSHYDTFECHVVIYPYSRKITANNFHFYPFEEYVKDINDNRKSAYNRTHETGNKLFGSLFAALVVLVVFRINPNDFLSVEAIVSAFGAYILGKDLWTDLERWLIRLTQNRTLRFSEQYYQYELDKNTTLTNYSYFAKRERYGKVHFLPQKMDFLEHSNSQTARLFFNTSDWHIENSENIVHILSLHVDPHLFSSFQREGFLLGIKLSFNRSVGPYTRCYEVFQSLHRDTLGCLDEKREWCENSVFYRQTRTLGRVKYFAKSGVLSQKRVINLG